MTAWRLLLGCWPLWLASCQLPTSLSTPPDNTDELAQLRVENQTLRQQIDSLRRELSALRSTPAGLMSSGMTPVLVTLPGPNSAPSSVPASAPAVIEEKVLLGRAEQDKLVSQYGEGYVADTYRRTLVDAPNDPAALYLAARFSPDPDDQLAYCQRAIEISPSFGFGHHCLSLAYRKRGEGVKALAAAEEAALHSDAVEISANEKELRQREMRWYTQPLSWLNGEASVSREFSLGLAHTTASLRGVTKGLACSASLRADLPWKGCAGVICGEVVFSYSFDGPEDPYYDHADVCGESLVFTDQEGKTLLSETKLPCSRLDNGKTTAAISSVCLPSPTTQIQEVRLNIPGEQTSLTSPTTLP